MKREPVVYDLDDIIERPITFKLHGRDWQIKAINLSEFLLLAESFTRLGQSTVADSEALARMYHQVFSSVIDGFELSDVQEMTQAQCASLLALILRRITGEREETLAASDPVEKKKTLNEFLRPN